MYWKKTLTCYAFLFFPLCYDHRTAKDVDIAIYDIFLDRLVTINKILNTNCHLKRFVVSIWKVKEQIALQIQKKKKISWLLVFSILFLVNDLSNEKNNSTYVQCTYFGKSNVIWKTISASATTIILQCGRFCSPYMYNT